MGDPPSVLGDLAGSWFRETFGDPTPAQELAWPALAAGESALVVAPTGSGKTLAAFLVFLDRLAREPREEAGVRVLYVTPLKALGNDIHRNLEVPLAGMGLVAERLGRPAPGISMGIRTGDTTQRERDRLVRRPPDVLITTPESLYLMLTSRAREFLADTDCVIVDEIHAVARTKRGAHLALTLERLEKQAGRPLQRIGLSATQRPLEEVGRFLVGAGRECRIVDAGVRKPLDLKIHVPVERMSEPDAPDFGAPGVDGFGTSAGGGDLAGTGLGEQPATSRSILSPKLAIATPRSAENYLAG
jgi:ATP-dependent Lhr-like helicase